MVVLIQVFTMKSLAACLVAAVSTANLYNIHKTAYWKSYGSEVEQQHRQPMFMQNKYERGFAFYRLAVNKFTDLTRHEFNTHMESLNTTVSSGLRKSTFSPLKVSVPTEMDSRAMGAVTAAKDQGQCRSCWAFSSTGALEGQIKQLLSLSEQNLIDCSTGYNNNGCNGSFMDNAFTSIKDNSGIDTQSSYPYEGINGECRYTDKNSGATVSDFVDLPEGDEQTLMQVAVTVSVTVDLSPDSFQFYSEGINYEPSCSSSDIDHAILVVGGTDKKGSDCDSAGEEFVGHLLV